MVEDDVKEKTRELALLAGEAFAQLRLEPSGFHRVTVEQVPSPDLVYVHDHDVVLIETLAADEVLRTARAADGRVVEAGTRSYVELAIRNMRANAPEIAKLLETALADGTLRYYEVRQPIDDAGKLGDIAVRQFAV
jgi:hypothetical protein